MAISAQNWEIDHSPDYGKDAAPGDQEDKTEIDPRLQQIVEQMFRKCYREADYKPAIGIAIEARRLDVVEEGINLAGQRSRDSKGKARDSDDKDDTAINLMEYVLEIAMVEVQEISLREKVPLRCARACKILDVADAYSFYVCLSNSSSPFPRPTTFR